MAERENIYLVGPMGSGKSSVGRQLAKALRRRFVDSDAEIEHRTGVDIRFIFEKEGEARFRAREKEVIAALTRERGIVLATGGGAVLDPENRRQLAATGFVVYLKVSIEQQWERTRSNRQRPLLLGPNPRATLAELSRIREPLYESIAHATVETGGRHVRSVVSLIKEQLERHAKAALASGVD
jgi:shikimate kinase